jgi:DNA gyrase/topoisomerase IV subunit A
MDLKNWNIKDFNVKEFENDLQKLIDWKKPLEEEIKHQEECLEFSKQRLEERKNKLKLLKNMRVNDRGDGYPF